MDKIAKMCAAAVGAAVSFFTDMPPLMMVLIGVMTLDYATGVMCGIAGCSPKTDSGKLSSRPALTGLMRKAMILLVVLLAVLLDVAVASGAGVTFNAVTGAVCLWFIASEGLSVLENAALMELPIPAVLLRALDIMRDAGGDDGDGTALHQDQDGGAQR